jgi:DNA segregation ATPase FtsK/SpoIIIE, S-DNA-T family
MPRNRALAASESPQEPLRDENRLLEELVAVINVAVAAFLFVSFYAYHAGLNLEMGGRVGYGLASAVVQALGLAAYLIPTALLLVAAALFFRAAEELTLARVGVCVLLILCSAIALGLIAPQRPVTGAGGWIGGFVASLSREAFGTLGSFLLVSASILLSLVFVTRISLARAVSMTVAGARRSATRAATAATQVARAPVETVARRSRGNVKREVLRPANDSPPVIVLADPPREDKPAKGKGKKSKQEEFQFEQSTRYQIPSIALLDSPSRPPARVDEEALHKSSQILETKLADFGIEGKVVEVRPGPVITTFDIEPAPGIKVNRILSLGDDLAMALRVPGVRILAPVPGKAVVGIEVANPKRDEVRLREMIESEPFARGVSPMLLALGKNTAGGPVVGDLGRMPHLLVAGATGSGKSVAINAMIMSMLYKAAPRDLRFVMIDLKMLELSVYEEIPHLLVPVVTDPKKAVVVLKNIVDQMDERYRVMKHTGVRNLDQYNRLADGPPEPPPDGVLELTDLAEDEQDTVPKKVPTERFPRVVVIIDELADLMMTMGRQVEEPITRLAQKARAAGIHLILATQRPSVDVITGLIKANFPARVSFQTTSRVDSRTILDHIGAERLLGGGDMLYMAQGTANVQRLHGPLVTEEEIRKVVNFIKRQGTPEYALNLLESPEGEDDAELEEDMDDELYDQAVRLVTESRQASISWVQRRLRVGYNRAARMIERMEREGVVSISEGGRPRDVLAQRIDAE